ncbi:MAG: CobQ/CobB/MinD/ParA nucleotide binding domain protein [Promethearchaeota archaeon]|nr:MAG: CobQ/CobB/MinD/ParA nucleotide binding domain protein [Candidatus Lokiarchaeota archaeon]
MKKRVVAFAGKGGVGKTTSLALFLKYLIEKDSSEILVIDSDPDANVGDVIGKEISFNQTLASKMTELKEKIQNRSLPLDMPKNQIIEGDVFRSLIEMDKFDILEMGRQEGSGCYCFINSVLKNVIDTLSENYDITLLDSPAGLEHFSRKTGRNVTDLIIVTDPSKMGIHTMKRIIELTKEVSLEFENIWIIGNRFPDSLKEALEKEVEEISESNIKLLGFLPDDKTISEYNFLGKNLLELEQDEKVYQKAKEIFRTII